MSAPNPDPVESLLAELLRQPQPQRNPGVERALLRLTAARADATYLLMHRALVLETALAQLREAVDATLASAGARAAAEAANRPRATAPARSFLCEAAVVTAGVLAGSVLAPGVASAVDGGDEPLDAGLDTSVDELF